MALVGTGLPAGGATWLSVSPNDGNPMFVATRTGSVYLSTDSGNTFMLNFPGSATPLLLDGLYTLSVDKSAVANSAGMAAGSGRLTQTFHPLYGDIDGNAIVSNADYAQFKVAFGSQIGTPQA